MDVDVSKINEDSEIDNKKDKEEEIFEENCSLMIKKLKSLKKEDRGEAILKIHNVFYEIETK